MKSKGIRKKLYEPLPVPTFYGGRVEYLLGRVLPFQCFLDDNATSTILYKYTARQKEAFEFTVPLIKALHHAGAAIFMRRTHGCGISAAPSLKLEGFQHKNRKDQQTLQV